MTFHGTEPSRTFFPFPSHDPIVRVISAQSHKHGHPSRPPADQTTATATSTNFPPHPAPTKRMNQQPKHPASLLTRIHEHAKWARPRLGLRVLRLQRSSISDTLRSSACGQGAHARGEARGTVAGLEVPAPFPRQIHRIDRGHRGVGRETAAAAMAAASADNPLPRPTQAETAAATKIRREL